MTEQQKHKFAELYDRHERTDSGIGVYQARIKYTCLKAQKWVAATSNPDDEAVELLVKKQSNGIANVGRSASYLQRAKPSSAARQNKAFRDLMAEMFKSAKADGRIDHTKYDAWKERFFKVADGYKLEVIFNRLVFAIFPEQFCSVPKPERLLRICNALQEWTGVRLSETPLADKDWFDLCELIEPVVREALPSKDYAARSAFLAAIGVAISASKGKKSGEDKSVHALATSK